MFQFKNTRVKKLVSSTKRCQQKESMPGKAPFSQLYSKKGAIKIWDIVTQDSWCEFEGFEVYNVM